MQDTLRGHSPEAAHYLPHIPVLENRQEWACGPKSSYPGPISNDTLGLPFMGSEAGKDSEAECPGSVTKDGAVLLLVCAEQQAANTQHRQHGASPRERRVVGSHRRGSVLPEGSSHTQGGQQPPDSRQFLFLERQPCAHTRARVSTRSKNLTLANSGTNWTLSAQAP